MSISFWSKPLRLSLLAWLALAIGQPLVRGGEHPWLFFNSAELEELRQQRDTGTRAAIWTNITRWADWCAQQPVRSRWIPTVDPDPQYENLYDRFYAAMHDLAVVEHLAFASALSDPERDPYFQPARAWLLGAARVWGNEKNNAPDASKAYAVLRITKGLAVGYDLLHNRLTADEQSEVRQAIVGVAQAYHEFFQDKAVAGAGYNKHHGSVDAPPLGIIALCLLNEVPEAQAWLDVVIAKHVDYLLLHALTPSGTNEQSSNFWASTMHYRIMFFEALENVTGRNLADEFPSALPGRIALAAVAGMQPAEQEYNADNHSVLFGPSYGQINYWAPVLVYLARRQRRPIYQHLAHWDRSLGCLQRTRYVTPNAGEELLFCLGPYAYVWYDSTVAAETEDRLPHAFEFPEPEVNEAYLRAGYELGDIVVGFKKGGLAIHAGGRPVLVDQLGVDDVNNPKAAVSEMLVADDGRTATIRGVGPESAGLTQQIVQLERPSKLTVTRSCSQPLTWWHAGEARRDGNSLVWPDGTTLVVEQGTVAATDPAGYTDAKEHYAGMKFADPAPVVRPTTTVEPAAGKIIVRIGTPEK